MKAVKQISLDILVGPECDGVYLAMEVMAELERRGYTVLGAGFQEDLTDTYEELLKEE